ncbi:MAG: response regulator [Phototrophicaceae bacterium]
MAKENEIINILLVDDVDDIRETTRRTLVLEPDFKVVGSVNRGLEGIRLAKELKPDVIIMDINMPDIDGIAATKQITEAVPTTAVIMMSINHETNYMRNAMMAGARNFLTKPTSHADLSNTIRTVYREYEPIRRSYKRIDENILQAAMMESQQVSTREGTREGHVIVCFSPKGGVGTTTIATNIASALTSRNTKVLLVDADVQFGDINVFLNLKSQNTVLSLMKNLDDLDVDLFENILETHGSGVKVLRAPDRPELADEIIQNPSSISQIVEKVRYFYDYIIIDTASRLDEISVPLCDLATLILIVSTPTLPSIRSVHSVLGVFDQLYGEKSKEKIRLVLSKVAEERKNSGPRTSIPREVIVKHLKRDVYGSIPDDEKIILQAINKGTPVIAFEREKSPSKELLQLAQQLRKDLSGEEVAANTPEEEKRSGFGLFGRQ